MRDLTPLGNKQRIRQLVQENIRTMQQILDEQAEQIHDLSVLVIATFQVGGKILLFGNGGSAADAQHVASEFVNRFQMDRPALPAIALTTDTSIITSVGNDVDFDQVYARQVNMLGRKEDLVVGISTSGNSPNVFNGILAARQIGARALGFTGLNGGRLRDVVDNCYCAPSHHTPRIQEAHILVWHIICEIVEHDLFKSDK